MKLMKSVFSISAALAVVLLNSAPAAANFIGSFSDGFNMGNFTLNAVYDGGGKWTALSGTLVVTAGDNLVPGTYDLLGVGDNPTSIVNTSPSSMFAFDNNFYLHSDPQLDFSGLLFVNPASSPNPGDILEVAFWGPASGPGNPNYSNFSTADNTTYVSTSNNVSFLIVPEPSTLAIYSVLFGLVAARKLLRRTSAVNSMVA